MAVYTDIGEVELGAFLREYDIGELLSYKGIAEGTENSNFLVHTSKNAFILTLYEKRVDRTDLPFFLALMEHLAGRGIECPLPVHRRDGQVIGELAGRPCAVITFLEGMWPRRPTVQHCREVGRTLAAMHNAVGDFAPRRENALSVNGWQHLWDITRERAGDFQPDLSAEIEAELAALSACWPQGLPSGVIHADLFPDNVFFIGERLSGVIDFYFACHDMFAYDLATCLNAWCFEKDIAFNITKGAALLSGYREVRPLSDAELASLPLLARGSALRFLLTRLHDWLDTPEGALVKKRDPMEYARRLRFHRAVDTVGEYGALS